MNEDDSYLSNAKFLFDPKSLSDSQQFEISKKSKRYRYLWMSIAILGLFCFQMIPYAITNNIVPAIASNLFAKWLQNNVILVNIFFALSSLGIALFGPVAGNWFSRNKKIKHIYITAFIITGISFICFSLSYLTFQINNLPATAIILYAFSLMMGAGISIFSTVGIAQLVNRWFPPSQKGFALGIVFMGGSLGTIIFSPILKVMLSQQWIINAPYFILIIFGSLVIVLGILLASIIVRNPLPIYELKKNSTNNQIDNKHSLNQDSVSVAQAKRYPYWYLLLFGELFLFFGIGILISQAQQSTNGLIGLAAADQNVSFNTNTVNLIFPSNDKVNQALVLNITTIYGVACLVGNFLGGKLYDKIGAFKTFLLGLCFMLVSGFSILFAPLSPAILPYFWALFVGFGIFIFSSTTSFLSSNLFGAKYSAKHLGLFAMFSYVGIFIGLIAAGLVAGKSGLQDGQWTNIHVFINTYISGNWPAVWIMCVCFLFVGGSLILIAIFHIKHLGISGINNYYHSNYSKILYHDHGLFLFGLKLIAFFAKSDLSQTKWFKNYLDKKCNPISVAQRKDQYIKLDQELKDKLNKYLKIKLKNDVKLKKRFNKNTIKKIFNFQSEKCKVRALKLIKKYEIMLPKQIHKANNNFKKYYYVMNYLSKIDDALFLKNKFEIIKNRNKTQYDFLVEQNEAEYLKVVDLANNANEKLKKYYEDPKLVLKSEYWNFIKIHYESKQRSCNEKINKLLAKRAKNQLHLSKIINDNKAIDKEQ